MADFLAVSETHLRKYLPQGAGNVRDVRYREVVGPVHTLTVVLDDAIIYEILLLKSEYDAFCEAWRWVRTKPALLVRAA